MRMIDADLAQKIADEELFVDEAGTVQFVLSHTTTITLERPKGEWISTDERLPEEDGCYITMTNATGKSNGVMAMDYRTATARGEKLRRWVWHDRLSPWRVTHWMPLPEPPNCGADMRGNTDATC